MATQIRGIYPMLYALFGADGRLDRGAFSAQVEASVRAGSHGLAVGGLATECNKLSLSEKRDLAAWTCETAAGRVPVSVTITDNTVAGQIEAVRHAADHGAGWVVLQPPPVRTASEEALITFFGTVADAAPVPVGIQNAPTLIGIGLSVPGLIELHRRHPNISIVKDEGTLLDLARLSDAAGGSFTLLGGRNGVEMPDQMMAGCTGMIPSVETCDIQSRIFENLEAGRTEQGMAAFREILPLLQFLMTSVDHLMCYGKRLAARRIGLGEVHDRGPAQAPVPFGLKVLDRWSRQLGEFEG
jgi:2-keto-3-deoxy-L-arabinonate dehydratase